MQREWKFTFRDSLVLSIAQKIWRKKAAPTRGVGKSSLAPLPALPPGFMGFHVFECSQKYGFLAGCLAWRSRARGARSATNSRELSAAGERLRWCV